MIGGSAGGYLALLSGTFGIKPQTIVSFYGYGDITSDWALKPSPHCQKVFAVPQELADMLISNDIITVGPIQKRYAIYMHVRQNGVWIEKNCGLGQKELLSFCSFYSANADYPPTLLLHGTSNKDVPYEQLVFMSETLTKAGVENQLITIPNCKHLFEKIIRQLGDAYYNHDFIFAKTKRQSGYPIVIKMVQLRMARLFALVNLNLKLIPYSLRHMHTSLLAEDSVVLEQIMDRHGHSDEQITKNVYLYVTKEIKKSFL